MNDSWAWSLATTLVVVGWGITLIPVVIGWIITGHRNKAEAKAKQEEIERANESLATLKKQLKVSQDATKSLREQVDALEESNRLYAAANPENVPPWGDAEWMSRSLYRIKLKGTRKVIVTGVDVAEQDLIGLLRLKSPITFPQTLEPGDCVEYLAAATMAGTPSTKIEWHWAGSEEARATTRTNIRPRY